MTIVVTGGAGFIGSALVLRLLAGGTPLVNVDALTYAANPASLAGIVHHPAYRFVQADIRDGAAMAQIMADADADAIIHLAAESHVDRSIASAAPFISTNVEGTTVLLDAALAHWRGLPPARRDLFRFVHVSTDEVFGDLGPEDPPFTESSPYRPSSPYAASKAAADHLVRAWGRTHGLPVVVSNCSNNYGPRQHPEKLIPRTILAAIRGEPVPVYGRGDNARDWLHVDDHAAALEELLKRGRAGVSYLIGGQAERRNLSVVETICDILDRRRPGKGAHRELIAFVGDRPGHDRRYSIDPSKIARELGFHPTRTFEAGLESTVDWYLDHESWWQPLLASAHTGEASSTRAR